jgi:hypothetical protein
MLLISQDIGVGIGCKNPSSHVKLFNHVASLFPSIEALYFISIKDKTTIDYRLLFHDIGVEPVLNK